MFRRVIEFIEEYDPGVFPEDLERRYGIPVSEVVNLGSNENPYPPPLKVVKEACKAAENAHRYPNPLYERLKEKLSGYVKVDKDRLAIGAGASELLDIVCKVYLDPFDRVVISIPTYTLYLLLAMLRDANITFYETESRDFRIETGGLKDAMEGAKLTFINSPNNPTGVTVSEDTLEEVLEGVEGIVVVDETYHEFAGSSAIGLLDKYDNLIIIRSMSKYFSLAGFRIGYSVSTPEIAEAIEKIRLPFSISSLAVKAAVKAIDEEPYFHKIRDEIISNRERVSEALRIYDFIKVYPSKANFLLIKVLRRPFKQTFSEFCAKRGVIIRSLSGLLGLQGEYVRVTVGTEKENRAFLSVCDEVEGMMGK